MWLWPQVLINGSLYRRICIINCVHQQPRSTEEQPTNTPRYFDKHIPPTPLFLPSSLDPCPSPTSTLWPSVSLTPSSSPAYQSPTSLANSCAFLVFAQATQPLSSHQTPIQLPRSTGVKMQFLKTVAVFLVRRLRHGKSARRFHPGHIVLSRLAQAPAPTPNHFFVLLPNYPCEYPASSSTLTLLLLGFWHRG